MSILKCFDLSGKTALVTGCKRGIGKAMTLALAEAGADIIGVSASLERKGSDIENEVTALNRNFKAFQCDLGDRSALYEFINQVKKTALPVDILINNAGIVLRDEAKDYSDESWDRVIEVNLSSQFILSREFGKEMINRKSGKIIFTASVLSFQGGLNVPGYAASKGALVQLIQSLSNEWASAGVNVNAIAPGYIRTDINTELQNSERYQSVLDRIPAGRWGEIEDLKGAVVFLASDASNYVSGTILTVDGGWIGR